MFLGGGELDQLLDMHNDVTAWAKSYGCEALTITGRFGWKTLEGAWLGATARFISKGDIR